MDIYLVGGAVRDELLGLPIKDRDWLVVGATAEELLALGYHQVGRDFPVFLHPITQEEYALARTERKTSVGYRGFAIHASPEVTLEQDLARRDLTINAIAKAKNGQIIDPFNGKDDLKNGILRHVSQAFCEDPVRILRVSRFAARFGFEVAKETMNLMRQMVQQNEVDYLIAERVWQEIAKGLMEQCPSQMFSVLRACGALSRIAPEIDALFKQEKAAEQSMLNIDLAAKYNAKLSDRFALLCLALNQRETNDLSLKTLSLRWKIPKEIYDLANLSNRYQTILPRLSQQNAENILQLLKSCAALHRPQRFLQLLQICRYHLSATQASTEQQWLYQQQFAENLLQAISQINLGEIAQSAKDKKTIPQLIDQAKLKTINAILKFNQSTINLPTN